MHTVEETDFSVSFIFLLTLIQELKNSEIGRTRNHEVSR